MTSSLSTTPTDLPGHVVVIGGGRMGTGIAHVLLARSVAVTMVESNPARLSDAQHAVAKSLTKAASSTEAQPDVDEMLARLSLVQSLPTNHPAGLVIEAVPESMEAKRAVLRMAEEVCPTAFLATNTSSLSVGEMAQTLERPARLIGLHFFNPVPTSSLIEVVVGAETEPTLVRAAERWVAALGKSAITVNDSPGFASSRLGVSLALEAIRMLEQGVASAHDIDTAMTLGYRHPMGPLRTTDIVGLDVRLAIADHLARTIGPAFEPPQLLREKVASGEIGRKAGRGFFSW
ncbi:3-hydroxybutyryl-CoA dehydrogenase [Rhodococcus sp. B7740]|uniref:3-hydroxyacyl-CoA dehydrogenase family protein n=1 Tax=Rhodococcus sp. B7740 TaxID=1564114 RepID=UPI0005D99D50|nr:3-hydroxyacyl-CoA dehydrogenase family protein [Rhodococcus sp. B7740]AJW40313.1 3-hydroxybutyryl-CoA dehydrogenase [Rhodococcus sp. B7740]